jgi:peptidoglycan-associated lipoprotein
MRPLPLLCLFLAGCQACRPQVPVVPLGGDGPAAEAPQGRETTEQVLEALRGNFERVHFALDSSTLDAAAQAALVANAAILQRHPQITVEVQGHADERGTTEYNLALGQRRGAVVVRTLQALGVSSARLSVVSYGEEHPLVAGSGEQVWAENRRAEFRILGAGTDGS